MVLVELFFENDIKFWACPSLRSGRRAAGYAYASVLRTVHTHTLRMPHAEIRVHVYVVHIYLNNLISK